MPETFDCADEAEIPGHHTFRGYPWRRSPRRRRGFTAIHIHLLFWEEKLFGAAGKSLTAHGMDCGQNREYSFLAWVGRWTRGLRAWVSLAPQRLDPGDYPKGIIHAGYCWRCSQQPRALDAQDARPWDLVETLLKIYSNVQVVWRHRDPKVVRLMLELTRRNPARQMRIQDHETAGTMLAGSPGSLLLALRRRKPCKPAPRPSLWVACF